MRSVITLARRVVGRSTKKITPDYSKLITDTYVSSSSAVTAEPLARQFGEIMGTLLKGVLLSDKNDASRR